MTDTAAKLAELSALMSALPFPDLRDHVAAGVALIAKKGKVGAGGAGDGNQEPRHRARCGGGRPAAAAARRAGPKRRRIVGTGAQGARRRPPEVPRPRRTVPDLDRSRTQTEMGAGKHVDFY